MTTQNQVSEIQTSAGILRVWDNSGSGEIFHFATPSGSQGSEPTFDSAVAAAFAAEGLDAAEYGYTTLATASHAAAIVTAEIGLAELAALRDENEKLRMLRIISLWLRIHKDTKLSWDFTSWFRWFNK